MLARKARTSPTKIISESLGLYIQNHVEYADQLIQALSNKLSNQDFNNALIDYDKQLLKLIIQISLTYCIATNKFYRYPSYLNKDIQFDSMIISLVAEELKFNQRSSLATVMNQYVQQVQDMLANGQSTTKIQILFNLFRVNFSANYFYQIINEVHDSHLEVINAN